MKKGRKADERNEARKPRKIEGRNEGRKERNQKKE